MAHFAEAFWSSDYAGGLGVLFGKLQQGVQENQQILTIARMRADAEESYGQQIGDIGPAADRITDGFSRDDGASVRKAYDGVRTEMDEAASKHRKIAANIRELVVYPFSRWCEQHAARVQNSQDELQNRVKAHDRQADSVRKLRSHYFNKCRLVEDLEEEDKLAFKEPQVQDSPKPPTPSVKVQEPDEFEEPQAFEIGDNVYQMDQMKKILVHILDNVPMGETKVPILGVYQNTTNGADLVEYIQKHLNGTSVSYAERVGQDLINNGFLRLVGNVGSVFANSSRMNYQWRPKVFKITGYPEKRGPMSRSTTVNSMGSASDSLDSPTIGSVGEYLQNWNPLNNPYPNESPAQKLHRESREADERYKAGIKKLDTLRCTLEEAIVDHLKFMERCEIDRLKAIKAVILDFSGAISNVLPSLQSTIDKMMLFQETVQPLSDLRYMLENYRVGPFTPKVQAYENYYNSVDEVTFGVDLEARARSDRKRVPIVVTTILMFLDNQYPLLDGDQARQAIWTVDVPLAASHRLRSELNTGKEPIDQSILSKYEVPIVASVLKLYLLELPDSLVSSSLYEIIKTIYSSSSSTSTTDQGINGDSAAKPDASTRVSVLQNTLSQLRLSNIATLDAVCTHFARLLDLTNASDEYTQSLTSVLAPCILRPKNTASATTFEDKSAQRFLRDVLAHKDPIFTELKRSSTLHHSASVARAASTAQGPHGPGNTLANPSLTDDRSRPRAISTDESNRRAHMEERNRAIASRSRAASPAPRERVVSGNDPASTAAAASRHRRDSSRGPETRFPVHPSPGVRPAHVQRDSTDASSTMSPRTAHYRRSLEVPGEGFTTPTSLASKFAVPPPSAGGAPSEIPTSATSSNTGAFNTSTAAAIAPEQQQQQQHAHKPSQSQSTTTSTTVNGSASTAATSAASTAGTGSTSSIPLMSATSGPMDASSAGADYYHMSHDSEDHTPPPESATTVESGSFGAGVGATGGAEVKKEDSLKRTKGFARNSRASGSGSSGRRVASVTGSGSLSVSQGSGAAVKGAGAGAGEGVQLSDRPMEFE